MSVGIGFADRVRLLAVYPEGAVGTSLGHLLDDLSGDRLGVDRVETYAEGLRRLGSEEYDVCLLAYGLDERDGVELLREAGVADLRTAAVVLTDGDGPAVAAEAARAGAVDTVDRSDLTPPLFERVVRYALERVRTDTVLRASESRFRCLFEHNPHAVYGLDHAAGTFIAVNPGTEALTGFTAHELIGGSFRDLIHPDSREDAEAAFALAASGRPAVYDIAIRHRDGHRVDIHGVSVPVVAHGELAAIYGTAEDVTERIRAEARTRFQANLLDAVSEAVVAVDLEGSVLYWNRAAEGLFGWSAEEAMGRNTLDLTPAGDSRDEAERIMAALRRGEHWSGEVLLRRKDGSTFPADVNNSPLLDSEGRRIGVVGITSDLSERKQLELRLRQAQRLEAVGRLAGGIAHDFNNVLTAIQGNAQLLELDLEDAEMRTNVEEILAASRRAQDLTRQLLAFSRRQVLQPKVLDLRAAVEGMEGMLRRLIGEHIELSVVSAPGIGRVRADPGQLSQVVLNLVVNARDALGDGGRVAIRLNDAEISEAEAAAYPYTVRPGEYVEIVVEDTGTGMDEDTLARVWEPFFSTKGDRGTGLGLPTVYGIVKQSEGYIWVDSEVGRGSTFRIYLPRVESGVEPDPEPEEATPPDPAGDLTVLMCEDDDSVRRLVSRTLGRHGYRVLEAHSPTEALELAEGHEGAIHLLLTDLVMPEMGGQELADRVRGIRAGIRLLLMSGYARDNLAGGSPIDPDVPFIQKPFTPAELAQRIESVMASGGRGDG